MALEERERPGGGASRSFLCAGVVMMTEMSLEEWGNSHHEGDDDQNCARRMRKQSS